MKNFYSFTERKVVYNFEKYGDSPTCLNKDEDIDDIEVFLQGSGVTENTFDSGPLVRFDNAKS